VPFSLRDIADLQSKPDFVDPVRRKRLVTVKFDVFDSKRDLGDSEVRCEKDVRIITYP
jgi:hypothetical protein